MSKGGILLVSSGGFADPIRVLSAGAEVVSSGGTDNGAQVSGGVLVVQSGGSATNTNVRSGGTEAVQSGAIVSGVISRGGALELVGSGATSGGLTVSSGVTFEFASGYVNSAGVSAGTPVKVLAGGTQDGGAVLSGGLLEVFSGGTASGATIDSGGRLIVLSGGASIDCTLHSGSTAINSAGGSLNASATAIDSGTLINSGAINVIDLATLTLGASIINAGSINLGSPAGANLVIDTPSGGNVKLTGGGTVSLGTVGNDQIIVSSGVTLINANNVIAGGGEIDGAGRLTNSGIIKGLFIATKSVTNAGLIEGTPFTGEIANGSTTNLGTIAALGINVGLMVFNDAVTDSTTKALILASGDGAHVNLDLSTINGGTLKTSAGGEIAVEFAPVTLRGVTIAASSLIEATAGGTLTLNNGTISAGAVIETNGGAAIISGVITNGGTLFAAGAGNLVEIVSGAVINGGVTLIGDGIVDIAGSSGETIKFLSNGSGGLEIADMPGHASAFSGSVTGFGGSDHSNHAQFIDLTQVVSSAGVITSRYVSANSGNTSGTLFVSSGGTLVAAIKMVGNYSAGNFVITSGNGGTVAITDPGVANGGSVNPGAAPAFDAHSGIIALGAQTTLAYGEDGAGIGGTLTVGDGRHAAVITLLGNYMAGAFVTAADGPGATALSETEQTEQRPLLTHPQA